MNLLPVLQNRDFSNRIETGRLRWVVNSMEWSAVGGCSLASLTAYGPELDLWGLIGSLRCPVTLYDDLGRACWWGYVDEAAVRVGSVEVGATVASMSNRLAVAYSFVAPGSQMVGQRKTTAFVEDAEAAAEYGKKERLASASGLTDAGALARRDAILAAEKWPQSVTSYTPDGFGSPRGRVRDSGAENSQSASLICRGWFETLSWQYASWAMVAGISYRDVGVSAANFGTPSNQKRMQQITIGAAAINALAIQLYARKIGAPADNLVAGLFAVDGSGNPTGSALASGSITAASLATSADWHTVSITEQELAAGTMYAIVLERSGALDGSNYFGVVVNAAAGYSGGSGGYYNGSAWVGYADDMMFEVMVNNQVETTTQIRDLVDLYGEFITGVEIDAASGVYTASFRDGDTTTLAEIQELLAMGGPNGRRYLAEVDSARRLHVWEEPAVTETVYMDRWGGIQDARGMKITPWLPPVGVWARLRDVIPASADTSKMADPTLQFIEGAGWSADSGLALRFRGQPSIEEFLRYK